MALLMLPHASYWLLQSPVLAMIWGWVATTWKASMKASCTTFQLHGYTLPTCAETYLRPGAHLAKCSGSSPTKLAKSSAPWSMVMKTQPSQVATRTSGSEKFSGSTWGKSQAVVSSARVPSWCQAMAWNGQRMTSPEGPLHSRS